MSIVIKFKYNLTATFELYEATLYSHTSYIVYLEVALHLDKLLHT